ncbi:hypothetical protein WH96_02485 [Kiloniella spongiae]|uniref:Uncharacterized protein n=1 Tax=Kiloniella spongiae TaxID=1489064 RepID=A0A0H2MNP9_9PROT|nr:hypothetical protein [Kiloniella spongiae]KLN62392.1 hypothetical protein WH96_02485 [Kiloniella spongiae]
MDREKDIDLLADEYLDLWITHLSSLQLTPWHLMADLSVDIDPAIIDLYRQWEAFYHNTYRPDAPEGPSPFQMMLNQGFGQEKGTETGGSQSQEKSDSVANAHDVCPDDIAELKTRLGDLTRQIAKLEAGSKNSGNDEGTDRE